jgi:GntR family transcriptional regulator
MITELPTLELEAMDHRLPLYARLADVLTKRIASGEWSPSSPLPSETTLAADYGVSIGTMRKAMQQLDEKGLLERRQGSGTYIRRARMDKSLFRFFRHAGGRTNGAVPDSRILRREVIAADQWPQAARGLGRAEKLIRIERLRLWENEPFLTEEIALPLPLFAPLMELDVEQLGPLLYPIYEKVCGQIVASAEESLTIGEADMTIARLLSCRRGAPVVTIERWAYAHDRTLLEWRCTRGRGDQFSYRVEIH